MKKQKKVIEESGLKIELNNEALKRAQLSLEAEKEKMKKTDKNNISAEDVEKLVKGEISQRHKCKETISEGTYRSKF